ncbi:repetitive organellar protein-like [Maniola hyperantus]|uniref:repetitive organellar protein-like n=1 Tax=Aphantopus hyperantus TaxID=2795564 RepID=UPI003748FE8D
MLRPNSPKSKELQHIIRQAVQCVIDYFFNLSKDTKRKVVARVKDYFRDEFSTTNNDKIYQRIEKQPRKVKKGPKSVLRNSEDTKSVENIDIEEISFKSHHDKYKPQLIQDRSEDTEFSTKTFGKRENVTVEKDNEEAVSIEKLAKRESNAITEESNIKSKYFIDNNPQVTYIKDKRGHNNKTKTRSKNANIKHSKGKLTHNIMTLYPENIEMENRNSKVRFKAKVPLKEGKINKAKKDKTLNYVAISHSAEINVHLKNDKIQFSFDHSKDHLKKDALMKVRAFRRGKEAYTAENKPDKKLKTIEFTTESYDRLVEEDDIEENYAKKIIETNENNEKLEEFNFENKPNRILKTIEITTENNIFLNNEGRTKEPKIIIDEVSLNNTTDDINVTKVSAVEDEKKKKEIEQKMKEELGNLLTSPATNATRTEAYTDIFEVMDNEFDLGPLK